MNNAFDKMFGTDIKLKFRLPVLNCKKALVIAPHPDDETLGCGATIHLLRENNCEVQVVLMTDGSGINLDKDISHMRFSEFNEAMKKLGCVCNRYLNFPDGKLELHLQDATEQLTEIIEKEQPEIIFTPYVLDYNSDHKYVNLILSKCINNMEEVYIAMYEIWTPILYPNCYLNVTHQYDTKLSAICCYRSQEERYKISDKSRALNDLRVKLLMRKNANYIEAFKTFISKDFVDTISFLEYNNWFEK